MFNEFETNKIYKSKDGSMMFFFDRTGKTISYYESKEPNSTEFVKIENVAIDIINGVESCFSNCQKNRYFATDFIAYDEVLKLSGIAFDSKGQEFYPSHSTKSVEEIMIAEKSSCALWNSLIKSTYFAVHGIGTKLNTLKFKQYRERIVTVTVCE